MFIKGGIRNYVKTMKAGRVWWKESNQGEIDNYNNLSEVGKKAYYDYKEGLKIIAGVKTDEELLKIGELLTK